MKNETRLNFLGLIFLVLLFGGACWRIFTRAEASDPAHGKVRLSFAHYLVYESNRRFFDRIIKEYERLHPGVEIEQIDVPPPVWHAWRQTRFTGATAPDIMQLGRGITEEQFALHMLPLTEALAEANPYNTGTELVGIPWQNTFVDRLEGSDSFREGLQEFYGVTTYLNVHRLYYNRNLLRAITGADRQPEDFQELLKLCRRTKIWAEREGRAVAPIVGSVEYARNFFDIFISQQTQRVAMRIDAEQDLLINSFGVPFRNREQGIAWLRGEWRLDDPEILSAWHALREVAAYFQPGFLTASRDDAGFLFKQGRGLMVMTGSWDANYLLVDTKFEVGAFAVPMPGKSDARYGRFVLGAVTENASQPSGGFGVTRASRHPEIAVDFLRFFTSRAINQRFANECLRIPVIRGATVPAEIAAFTPEAEGYQAGFNLSYQDWAAKATQRLTAASMDLLVMPAGGVEPFLRQMNAGYERYLRQDFEFLNRDTSRIVQWRDTLLLALAHDRTVDSGSAQRAVRLAESQTLQEAEFYQNRLVLAGDASVLSPQSQSGAAGK